MLKRHKFNEKKLLHKIGKHWCVVSIAMLGLIGGIGMSQQSIHADTTNAPKVTATAKSNNTTNINDTVKTNNDNSVQHGTWDNVNVNYYPDDTMELTGDGTINSDHAPQSLPFNSDKNDWDLKITQGKANVTLNNSDGYQLSNFNSSVNHERTIKRNIRHRSNINDDEINSIEPFWSHFKSMDLSGLNTSKVNNMSYMFAGDNNLLSLNLSGSFNTKNVPEESDISSNGMANMFANTKIGKIKLGQNSSLNKANQSYGDGGDTYLDINGNNVTSKIINGQQSPGTYYVASYPTEEPHIHLIDNTSNKILSIQSPYLGFGKGLSVPLIHDGNYQNIMRHQMNDINKQLNIPNGYKELPDSQQDYTNHISHNEALGNYINVKLVKDPNVNYQSTLSHDVQLSRLYNREFEGESDQDYMFNDAQNKLMNSFARTLYKDSSNINTQYANSYTVSQANSYVENAGTVWNSANSLFTSVSNAVQSQSNNDDSDYDSSDASSASSSSSDQDSSRASSASEDSNTDSGQLSQSTSISYVNVPTDNVDLSSYNNEITSLSNQVASSSNEFNKMDNEIRSLNDEVTHLKSSKNTSRRARHRGRVNKRSAKNYKLPRTNSKYWNRVRNVKAKHGFRIYQVHTRFNRKSRILRTKLIKANQRIGVIRYRKSNKSWIVTGHNLHHYRHYYWIYKGDQKFPNHFKMIK